MEQIGQYRITRRLGAGAMGEVYEGVHLQIERHAAIKILHRALSKDRETVQRFLNEARAVNIISHPSVVGIYEYGQLEDGAPYIVMEFLQGETLRDRMRSVGRMEPYRATRIARQISSALAAAHAKQVVHRDLKPVNIMLVADPESAEGERVKVLDFGIAKVRTPSEGSELTRTGVTLGTPTYMAPEMYQNAREANDRCDVYALGVILYELLAGAPPFSDADGVIPLVMAHMHQDPPPLAKRAPDAAAPLCALVHRMLAKAPSARPSAAEVSAALSRLPGGASTAALPVIPLPAIAAAAVVPAAAQGSLYLPPPPEEKSSAFAPSQRSRIPVAAAVAAVLLGIGGIFGAYHVLRPPPPAPSRTWSVSSEPADAEVRDETGLLLGQTPLRAAAPPRSGASTLTISKSGFREETRVLRRDRDEQIQVVLAKLPVEAPAVKVAEPETPVAPAPTGKPRGKRTKQSPKTKKRKHR